MQQTYDVLLISSGVIEKLIKPLSVTFSATFHRTNYRHKTARSFHCPRQDCPQWTLRKK